MILGSLVIGSLVSCASAAFRATLVNASLERADVQVESISAQEVRFKVGQGDVQSMPLDQLLWIERPPVRMVGSQAEGERFVIELRDGQRWSGVPGPIDGETLQWTHAALGPKRIPLKDVQNVTRADAPVAARTNPTQDELRLTNGDTVVGVVSGGDTAGIDCQPSDGPSVRVAWENIRQLRLAAAGEPSLASSALRVELRDGSLVDVAQIETDSGAFRLDGGRAVPLEQLAGIENRNGQTRLLAQVPPASMNYAPYFPRTHNSSPVESIRSLSVAGLSTRSFVAARPHSVLSWTLDGSAKRFRTRYAVADGKTLADVTVRIRLDDRVVHEQANVRAGKVSDAIDVEIDSATSLTLEVDFGENYDVQDVLYWIEPALFSK